MNFNEMIHSLNTLQLKYRVINWENGGKLVILQRGARMLGIFPNEGCSNLLWTPPILSDTETARVKFVEGSEWNIGGDRTWLSPEIEYNIGDVNDLWGTYAIQAILDPGSYQFKHADEVSACLVQQTAPQAYHSQISVPLEINKAFRAITDPLQRVWNSAAAPAYSFVGYETAASVKLIHTDSAADCSNKESMPQCIDKGSMPQCIDKGSITDWINKESAAPLSLWHLAQLPAGGQIIIPTYGTAEVSRFFGSADSPRISVERNVVNLTIDAAESFKISIKVPYITGRMGYYREVDSNHATLIVRHFNTKPAAEYGDVFVPNLDDPGHCVQGYNDDGTLGAFGEMEYHTPLMNRAGSQLSLEDVNETYCYFGEVEAIAEIRSLLLGA